MLHFIGFYDYTVILTYASLVSAFLGMHFAHHGCFGASILCLMACGICDAFDGTVARSKKNRTDDERSFGIQLDSLCDVISFGIFPAFICYCMGMSKVPGVVLCLLYCICAVIRLAFFNVLEITRQQTEGGTNKYYRGLPVTCISILFPLLFLLTFVMSEANFLIVIHFMLAITAFLFIFDFKIKKPDITKLFSKK